MSQQINRKTGHRTLDDYVEIMIEFRAWCEERHLNFREELAGWALSRMGGKDAPAQAAGSRAPREMKPGPARKGKGTGTKSAEYAYRFNRGRPLVVDELPGRVFSHPALRRLAGLCVRTSFAVYMRSGKRVAGRYRVTYASDAQIRAAEAAGQFVRS